MTLLRARNLKRLAIFSLLMTSLPATAEPNQLDWTSYGGRDDESHYSPAKQINTRNVSQLSLAWYRDLPAVTNPVTAPIEVDGIIYFVYGLGDVYAVEAATGKPIWSYDAQVHLSKGRNKMRIAWGVRGLAYRDGVIYSGTLDGRLQALNARDGSIIWSTTTVDADDQQYITGAPWVYKDTVVIGNGGADFAARGYVTAYDRHTGQQRWRFYTVPGDPNKGFENKAMQRAAATWSGTWWKQGGGGTVWNAMAYDADLNLLYFGTGNGAPWNNKIRSEGQGDNLFLTSIIAVNADSGEYVWHYQVNPAESWDYNANMDIQLADLEIGGRVRKVLMQAPKNGFFYVLDRKTGELLSAEKFATVNWAEKIDLATGRPVEVPGIRYPAGQSVKLCPSMFGAHNISAMSFNPGTGLVYIPKTEMCGVYTDPAEGVADYQPQPYRAALGIGPPKTPIALPKPSSALLAWDPVKQQAAWEIDLPYANNGGTLTTAGGLVVQGRVTGELVIVDARSGKELWRFDAQTGIQGHPITYVVDGKQYLSVVAGWRHVGTGVGMAPDWDYRTQKRRLLTFSLSGKAVLPAEPIDSAPLNTQYTFSVDPMKAAVGAGVYEGICFFCHGMGLHAGGAAPDLKRSAVPASFDALKAILRGGLAARGMPAFEDVSDEEIIGLQHYILQQTQVASGKQP